MELAAASRNMRDFKGKMASWEEKHAKHAFVCRCQLNLFEDHIYFSWPWELTLVSLVIQTWDALKRSKWEGRFPNFEQPEHQRDVRPGGDKGRDKRKYWGKSIWRWNELNTSLYLRQMPYQVSSIVATLLYSSKKNKSWSSVAAPENMYGMAGQAPPLVLNFKMFKMQREKERQENMRGTSEEMFFW